MIRTVFGIYRIPFFTVSLSVIIAAVLITGLHAQTGGERTIQTCITEAEQAQTDAQDLRNALGQALAAAEGQGDTDAILQIQTAIAEADVRLEEISAALDSARSATTVEAAAAAAEDAKRALASMQTAINQLPRNDYYNRYVAPVVMRITGTITTETTMEITTETTISSTTSSSTSTTIKPVSPHS